MILLELLHAKNRPIKTHSVFDVSTEQLWLSPIFFLLLILSERNHGCIRLSNVSESEII